MLRRQPMPDGPLWTSVGVTRMLLAVTPFVPSGRGGVEGGGGFFAAYAIGRATLFCRQPKLIDEDFSAVNFRVSPWF